MIGKPHSDWGWRKHDGYFWIPVIVDGMTGPDTVSVKFKCPHCRAWHTHGLVERESFGHRVAHCHRESPYREKGYFIYRHEDEALVRERAAEAVPASTAQHPW